ncbi:MAG: molecular chaperone TorD family protein [Shewanella psychromarinicola]|jgi:TorA maturation chaperone TorD|uniref:TorD/DmsD family molecular chaperone n=1 Tax=Shewanella TaxID=22 RepID=UPI001E5B67AB|nr:molecular chaperone TorD family protein [Shewanella sp. Actino-trap-3]|tara:strand:- start:21826 stop:22482 length:657 start_codon:yes stop_codon:yes gene_type:complete
MNIEKLQDLQAIANVLHSVLTVYPESDLINTFKQQDIVENWPKLLATDPDNKGLTHLKAYIDQWTDNEEELLKLKLEYGVLFYGPGTPLAAPWGSAYTSSSQLLNDHSTITLKRFYAANNINIDMKMNEPVDHIGLIFAVLSFLLNKAIEAPQNPNIQQAIDELLEQHLLPWAYRCLELAYTHAETDYYRGFSILARDYLLYLEQTFELTPKKIAIYR